MTAGQTLAQFEILEPLGEGEFGAVYKARDTAEGREVTLEMLPGRGLDADRLRQEVQAARALDHWSIAKVYEVGRAGDSAFLVREFVAGRPLAEVLASGPLAPAAVLDCARQIAGALAAGHAIGVTHRHLHPANILLAGENSVKLVNFGLTPARRDTAYSAPEQLDGRGADARADIYAFGLVLRQMAGDAAPKPLRSIIDKATRKDAARRYQLMEDVLSELDAAAAAPAGQAAPPKRRLALIAAALLVVAVAVAWWMLGGRASVHRGPMPLTSDSGLTTDPAISADARLVAYASDRESPGTLHIFVQPASGGRTTRLTDGADDDRQPAFSPDAARLVFRSEREGGGLYVVPVAGGTPQRLAEGGNDPRFSPDGRWIAYWSGDPLDPEHAGVWVISAAGGAPQPFHPEFLDARYPIWSQDGRHLLFIGRANSGRQREWNDWYVAPISQGAGAGKVIRTGAQSLLRMQALRESRQGSVIPEEWRGGQVLFSGQIAPMGRQSTGLPRLLRIPISSIMEAGGAAHEVTDGKTWDAHPRIAANGRLVFARREAKAEIWSVSPDGSGEPQRMTPDTGDVHPSVSLDGRRLAYRFHAEGGRDEIRVLDAETGRRIAAIPYDGDRDSSILLSPAGDELVYSSDGIYRVHLPGGAPQRVNHRGWDRILSWSADGKRLLIQRGWRGVGIVDVDTGRDRDREFLRDDEFAISEARFSPDAKWVVFTLASRPDARVYAVPVDAPESRIAVTPEGTRAGSPAWSADGTRIYYVARCQGFRCIWARRFDPRRKQVQGDAFPVRHFHHARYALISAGDPQSPGLAAARDKLVLGMFETTGNVWSLPSLPRP